MAFLLLAKSVGRVTVLSHLGQKKDTNITFVGWLIITRSPAITADIIPMVVCNIAVQTRDIKG